MTEIDTPSLRTADHSSDAARSPSAIRPGPARELNHPKISIIIPVHNGSGTLRRCLASLKRYRPRACEIVVVDDGSIDSSAEIALSSGARLERVDTRGGPSAARNWGARVARGDILVFLDADVCVRRDTLDSLTAPFADKTMGAVFGSYDAEPAAPYMVSQYRNLLHHYFHQTAKQEASTFWAGCGAVRRSLFFEIGGFDPEFTNPSVEDIDFGMRLRKEGHKILVNRQAQVKHLKRWTLKNMCTCDLWQRGVPWSRLILREWRMPNDLNVKFSQRLCVMLTFVLLALFGIAAWQHPAPILILVFLIGAMQVLDAARIRTHLAACAVSVLSIGAIGGWTASHNGPLCVGGLAAAVGIFLVNADFYYFLCQAEGLPFAVAAFPLHLLYYLICGLAFMIALSTHLASAVWPSRSHRADSRRSQLSAAEVACARSI